MMMDEQYKSSFALIREKRYFIVKPEKQYFDAAVHVTARPDGLPDSGKHL